ncbi:MAG: DJ-1/PfpI family protein [Paracoccaceae bacterium]|nr:DJ-1/PfpI family protein [Paracoccaceae bacterium]
MYGILIYDGVEPIDIGATFGVLSMARRIAPDLNFAGVAREAGEVLCASGLKMQADFGFDDAPAFDDLIVTGGPGWTDAAADVATLDYLRGTAARITSVCTGAMILAAAGLLDGKQATTKHEVFAGETNPATLFPSSVTCRHAALIDDGGTVTGGGVSLGIDTMFYCLARSHGPHVARETARVMEYERALAANRAALGYTSPG